MATWSWGRIGHHAVLAPIFERCNICVNDIMAVGALMELRERGLQVPSDEIAHTVFLSMPRDDSTKTVARRSRAPDTFKVG